MTTGEQVTGPAHTGHERHWCSGTRNNGIFWGIVLLALGVIWIGKATGLIPIDMSLFWPSVMIIAGVWILGAAVARRVRSS
jgi:hypothetical protein